MFIRLQDLVPREFNRHGLAKTVTASSICDHAKKVLTDIFPPEAQEFVAPKTFKEGTLTLQVPDGGWAEVIISRKEEIIKAMNAKFGQETIKQLKAKIGTKDEEY